MPLVAEALAPKRPARSAKALIRSSLDPFVASAAISPFARPASRAAVGKAAALPSASESLPPGPDAALPATFPTGFVGPIYEDAGYVIDAQGCANPTHLITFAIYIESGCDKGLNQQWHVDELEDRYDALIAEYGGNALCMNVEGGDYADGTSRLAWPCNNVVTTNEQFRRPENTAYPYESSRYYIVPAEASSLALNVAGGLGDKHNIILWSQCNCDNEAWHFG